MQRFWVILFGLLSLLSFDLLSQDSEEPESRYWVSVGLGGSHFGPGFYGSCSYSYKHNLFFVRFMKGDEFRWNPGGAQYDDPQLTLKEAGILYGRCYTDKSVTLSLSAGVGYVQATDRGKLIQYDKYERISISTVGVPFEITVRAVFGPWAIGGCWAGNVNANKFISAGVIQLSFGAF